MKQYESRHYLEICYILLQKRIETDAFRKHFKLNSYLFNKDCNELLEISSFYGIKLYINESIYYKVVDQELYSKKFRRCRSYFYRHQYINRKHLLDASFIGIKLIMREKGITLDELALDLSCSKSNLREKVFEMRRLLNSYNIEVKSNARNGLIPKGSEFNIRLCLLALYSNFDPEVVIFKDNVDTSTFYDLYDSFSDELRGIIRKTITHHGIILSNTNRRRLRNYITIQRNRILAGKSIKELSIIDVNSIKNTQEYNMAKEIYSYLFDDNYFDIYESYEIASLTILIITYREYTYLDDKIIIPKTISQSEIVDLFENMKQTLDEDLLRIIKENEVVRHRLVPYIYRIYLENKYDLLRNFACNLGGKKSHVEEFPLMLFFKKKILSSLMSIYGYEISTTHVNDIMVSLSLHIMSMEIPFRKMNIAIISRDSNVIALYLKDLLYKIENYCNTIECLEYHNCVDNRHLYDVIISDTHVSNKEKTDNIYVFEFDNSKIDRVIDFIHTKRDFYSSNINNMYVSNITCARFDSALINIALAYKEKTHKNDIWKIEENNWVIYDDILFIIKCDNSIPKADIIIGKVLSKHSIKCSFNKYVMIVMNVLECNISFVNNILHSFGNDSVFVEDFMSDPTKDLINKQINRFY